MDSAQLSAQILGQFYPVRNVGQILDNGIRRGCAIDPPHNKKRCFQPAPVNEQPQGLRH